VPNSLFPIANTAIADAVVQIARPRWIPAVLLPSTVIISA
jgi:hypothetical protein